LVIEESIRLASDPQAHYDYYCIGKYIMLRILCERLNLPMPLSWHRDERQICSEALYEVFYRAGFIDILPPGVVPLPGDFVTSSLLEEVGTGTLIVNLRGECSVMEWQPPIANCVHKCLALENNSLQDAGAAHNFAENSAACSSLDSLLFCKNMLQLATGR